MISVLLLAAVIAVLPAYIAHSKGRSFMLWWIYGVALFIIALLHSLLMKANKRNMEFRQLSLGMRKCVYCAEMIKQEAMICRFCGKGYIEQGTSVQAAAPIQKIEASNSLSNRKEGMSINDFYKEQRSGSS